MNEHLTDAIQSLEVPRPKPTHDELLQFAEKMERFFMGRTPDKRPTPPQEPVHASVT